MCWAMRLEDVYGHALGSPVVPDDVNMAIVLVRTVFASVMLGIGLVP